MSPKLLQILSPAISETLSNIFNESFALGVFPDHLKLAMITPISKGGSKLDVSNYRPVSVLPIISKVLEKLMLTRLTKYLDKSKILYGLFCSSIWIPKKQINNTGGLAP